MKPISKPRSKKRSPATKRIEPSRESSGGRGYLTLILTMSLLNFFIGVAVLSFTLMTSGWVRVSGSEFLAKVQADPATGLIVPQKPIEVDINPSERGTGNKGDDVTDKGWLSSEQVGTMEEKGVGE